MSRARISTGNWPAFFDALGRSRHGCSASLDVKEPEAGEQRAIDSLPLQGLCASVHPSEIVMSFGATAGEHVVHVIELPVAVFHEHSDSGDEDVIEIASAGCTTRLRIRAPELPGDPLSTC